MNRTHHRYFIFEIIYNEVCPLERFERRRRSKEFCFEQFCNKTSTKDHLITSESLQFEIFQSLNNISDGIG